MCLCCKIYVTGFVKCQTVNLGKVERSAAVPKLGILTSEVVSEIVSEIIYVSDGFVNI